MIERMNLVNLEHDLVNPTQSVNQIKTYTAKNSCERFPE